MGSSPLTVRDLAADDLGQVLGVRARSFGPLPEGLVGGWYGIHDQLITARRGLVVVDGERVVAYARLLEMRQWWGGHSLPMSGIAGVVVAPEHRGRGVGTLLMRAVAERAAEVGDVVSVLYPATLPVYRRLGWELAGAQHRVSVQARLLRRLGGDDVAVRQAGPDDTSALVEVARTLHERARITGPRDRSADEVRRSLEKDEVFSYLADDGFCRYSWHGPDDGELVVHELVAGSESTARALWSVVGSGSSTVQTVHAYVSPRDPLPLLLGDNLALAGEQNRWMLRVIDLAGAVTTRGFPPAAAAAVPLEVDDPLLPANTGSWLLRVEGGSAALEPGPGGGLRVGPNGLAALFAGTPVATLRVAGLAGGGDPGDDAVLDTVFAADPYLLDYF